MTILLSLSAHTYNCFYLPTCMHKYMHAGGVQNLDEAVCISHRANTTGKGINSTILPSIRAD